jgi:hypothetical protein
LELFVAYMQHQETRTRNVGHYFTAIHLPKVSLKPAGIACVAIILVLLYSAFQMRSYQTSEFDEGVYLATFRSVQHGFPLYTATYLSQLPGFFVTTFPLYALFGSTLEAARLAVFFYSLLGLIAIVWLGWELKSTLFGFIAIGVLYLVPIYTVQIMTFHADSLPSAFSTLALASILRFRNTKQWLWVALSAFFVTTAVMIKADFAVLPSLLVVLIATLIEKRRIGDFIRVLVIFAAAVLVSVLLFTLPFGINNVYDNVIQLRMRAAQGTVADPQTFINFFKEQKELVNLLIAGAVLSVIAFIGVKTARFPLILLFLWVVTTIVSLLIYHPLLPHHLAFLAVPIVAFFAFSVFKLLDIIKVPRVLPAAVSIFVVIILFNRLNVTSAPQPGVATPLQQKGIQLVQTYSAPGDYIISDDGIVSALSDRRIPPYLTDISFVRIASGGVTRDQVEDNLKMYHPKMVLLWADRLRNIPGFDGLMQEYHYRLIDDLDTQHQAYVLAE